MKKLISLLVFVLLLSTSYGQELVIEVLDEYDLTYVENAKVSCNGITVSTNDDGQATLLGVSEGILDILIQKEGYNDHWEKDYDFKKTTSQKIQVYLQALNLKLDQILVSTPSKSRNGYIGHSLAIHRSEVNTKAGAFEDPTRLMVHEPGIVQASDQANYLSIRGMNPAFNEWTINGVPVINPNHQPEAGVVNEQYSRAGGGVNMISSNILKYATLDKTISPVFGPNALAGVISMEIEDPRTEDFSAAAQLGLIGLEAKIKTPILKSREDGLLVNARYSFTGLLGKLGIDFDGEEISYTDIYASYKTNIAPNQTLELTNLYAQGENSPSDGLPSRIMPSTFYDYLWSNIKWHSELPNGLSTEVFLSYNQNTFTESFGGGHDPQTITGSTGPDQVEDRKKLSTGIHLTFPLNSIYKIKYGGIYSSNKIIENQYNSLKMYFGINRNSRFSFDADLILYKVESLTELNGQLSLQYLLSDKIILKSRNALISDEFSLASMRYIVTAFKNDISLNIALGNQWIVKSSAFYNSIYDINNLQLRVLPQLFIYNPFNFLSNEGGLRLLNNQTSSATTTGIELSIDKKWENWGININGTLLDSQSDGLETIWNSRYNLGLQLNYKNKINDKANWGISLASNYREGLNFWQNSGFRNVPATVLPFRRLGNYFRNDLRIFYNRKGKKFTSFISLDIQNVTNQKNESHYLYSSNAEDRLQYHLGIIPVLSYRISFGS